mmetsp:Transcript_15061/g.30487  ORF Transcript_15061/g.30487 Transcript_15061/m.30487 type:complete len:185 (-) Transcript_15061:370-924(-)
MIFRNFACTVVLLLVSIDVAFGRLGSEYKKTHVSSSWSASHHAKTAIEASKGGRKLANGTNEQGQGKHSNIVVERPNLWLNIHSIEGSGGKKLNHGVLKTMRDSMKEERPKDFGKGFRNLRRLRNNLKVKKGFDARDIVVIDRPDLKTNWNGIEIAGRKRLSHDAAKTMKNSMKEGKSLATWTL